MFIAGGSAKLVANHHVLAFHFTGEIVSLLCQSDGDFRLAALSDLELVVFSADEFLDVAQADPKMLRSVIAISLQALERSRTKMMRLGHKTARQRVADFLHSMAERMHDATKGQCELELPMSRRDIGESLGLTIETVSRQFTELRELGLIETTGRSGVRIPDLRALSTEAGQ